MSVNSKMTAIANEIRELSGTTGAMGLDDMAMRAGEANNEITIQANLISQISTALEGKGVAGATPIKSLSGTIYGSSGLGDLPDKCYIYTDDTLTTQVIVLQAGDSKTISIAKNTIIALVIDYDIDLNDYSSVADIITSLDNITDGSRWSVYLPTENNFEI